MFKSKRIKKLAVILMWLGIIVATIHIVLFAFLNVNGKNMVVKYIKTTFSADADLDSVSFTFPFTVVIRDFKCKDLSFSRADISLLWFNPFNSHLFLNWVYLDDLKLKVDIKKDKVSVDPVFVKEIKIIQNGGEQPEQNQTKGVKNKPKNINITIRKLAVRNAAIGIVDSTRETPVTFILDKVNLQLGHFSYPKLGKFYINMDASLKKQDITADNLITMKGWVDYAHKNMSLKFKLNRADYVLFSEYYPPFWKPDNLGIKDAKLSLDTTMNSLNNDLIIEAVLVLDSIEFMENPPDPSRVNTIKTMIALFKGDNEKPTLPVKIKTKMDSFNIDLSSLKSQFQGKMKFDVGSIVFSILDKAKSKVTGTTTGAVDKTKEAVGAVKDVTVNKTVDTIKGVVGTIEDVVKSYKKKKKAESTEEAENAQQAAPGQEAKQAPNENVKMPQTLSEQNLRGNITGSAPVNTGIKNQTGTQSLQPEPEGQNTIQSKEPVQNLQNVTQSAPQELQNQNQTQSAPIEIQNQTQGAQ